MLRITTIASAKAAESYYFSADCYLDEEAVPARWHGKGAERLGLQGEVAFEHFAALCRNNQPLIGKRITAASRSNRRVGYDLTFSVSKSVSILYGLAGDERILKAFRESVHDTMRLIEQHAAVRVRKRDKDEDRVIGNLVYSDFIHSLSRPVDGVPQPRQAAGQHLILDEASLASVKDMLALARIADCQNFNISQFDDRRQNKAVCCGNILAVLEDFAAVPRLRRLCFTHEIRQTVPRNPPGAGQDNRDTGQSC